MAPPAGQIRPLRYLAAFAGIVAVLYVLVFLTGGRTTPKLGIDLQGGTRVTLTARTEDGRPPPRDQLDLARQIIEQRVNALGVAGAEVVQDGNNLVITIPGDDGEQAKSLGQTARLRIRPVQQAVPAAAASPQEPPAPGAGQPPTSGAPSLPSVAPTTGARSAPADTAAPVAPQQAAALLTPAAAPRTPSAPAAASKTPSSTASPTPAVPSSAPAQQGQPTVAGPADPRVAAEIAAAKAQRQSTDPQVQSQALQDLNCSAADPLRGYDDPVLPLVSCDREGADKYLLGPSILDGTEIDSASAGSAQGLGYVINVTFKSAGQKIWGDYTSQHIGDRAAFVLDSQVVSAPTIQAALYGQTEISGQFTQASAADLARVLRYGSLPLSFDQSEGQTVSATLGIASLHAGLIAGGIGLALVFLYCLVYYRALGVLTILSLVLSGLIVYAVLVLLGRSIGFTLDLAGIAGFIVAIGITADSFVVFFERLKDEVREGRSFRSAVPRGWVRARRTILSADAVSFLASAVLYALAVGQVKGFAFTLGMSTVLDLVVVFLVTHPLVALAADSKLLSSPGWSGLGSVTRIGAARRQAAAATAKGA